MIEFKEFEKSFDSDTAPDLTPLIDMVFLLLIFFLLTSLARAPEIPVDLPDAEVVQYKSEQENKIIIKKTGELFFNGEKITEDELYEKFYTGKASGSITEISIQADEGVIFKKVVSVMDLSKKAGIEDISFLVEKKNDGR